MGPRFQFEGKRDEEIFFLAGPGQGKLIPCREPGSFQWQAATVRRFLNASPIGRLLYGSGYAIVESLLFNENLHGPSTSNKTEPVCVFFRTVLICGCCSTSFCRPCAPYGRTSCARF